MNPYISNSLNRFRWAACQTDVLQRLKPESSIIRNTLAPLPKTLDETYERIFLGIPNADRVFIHQALKWIYCHNELYNNDISCSMLLKVIEQSTSESTHSTQDYLYDIELLRELCGCLITLQQEDRGDGRYRFLPTKHTVSFAHYTVWEFLDSTRIFDTSAAWFAVTRESTKLDFMTAILLETLNMRPKALSERECTSNHQPDVADTFNEDFSVYCVVSSILCLGCWGCELSKKDDLSALAFSFLDPTNPHYTAFQATAQATASSIKGSPFLAMGIDPRKQFWKITWNTPSSSTHAVVLISLLNLDQTYELTKKYLERTSLTNIS